MNYNLSTQLKRQFRQDRSVKTVQDVKKSVRQLSPYLVIFVEQASLKAEIELSIDVKSSSCLAASERRLT